MTIHKIPAQNLEDLQARIAKLNKAAAKLGVSPIRCDVVDRVEQVVSDVDALGFVSARRVKVFFLVDVEGQAPKFAGWTLGATLEHTEAGVIVRSVPGVVIPESFRSVAKWCDHCQTARSRKDTFVVVHEDGSAKQIGRNCIRDFLGHQNPEALASFAEHIIELDNSMSEFENDHGVRGEDPVFLHDVLVLSAAAIRQHGWVSRAYAEQSGITTTSARVKDHVYTRPSEKTFNETRIATTDADQATANEALVYIGQNLATAQAEYEHNLYVTSQRETIGSRDFGIACSMISYVARQLEREVIRRQERASKSNERLGQEGERLSLNVTLVNQRVMGRQQYGYYDSAESYLYKFEDATGNLLTWFSSRDLNLDNGKSYSLTGTVKGHTCYNGRFETKMSRCKLQEVA